MRFAEVPCDEDVKRRLVGMVDSDRLPHALLISGPSGAGKLALARALAQYIHCENPIGGDSCGKCPACLQHRSFNNPDMYYVYPVINKESSGKTSESRIQEWRDFLDRWPFNPYERWLEALDAGNSQPIIYTDEANVIIAKMALSPYHAKYKVTLIWLPEKFQEGAANKLLKLIEEPWGDTKFILVSNEPGAILPTIFSRTQRVNVGRPSQAMVEEVLRRHTPLQDSDMAEIARLSDGNINRALALTETRGETEEFLKLFQETMRMAYARRLREMKDLSDKMAGLGREKIRRMLAYFSAQVRENFIYNLRNPALNNLSGAEEEFSRRFSPFINASNAEAILRLFTEAETDISRNANSKIVLFDMSIQLIMLIKQN